MTATLPFPRARWLGALSGLVRGGAVRPRFWLVCIAGPRAGERLLLADAALTFGRGPECDVVLDDPGVSRLHARCVIQPGGARLIDAGSANGSWIDGRRAFDEMLAAGDQFQIGASTFALIRPGEAVSLPRAHLPALDAPDAAQSLSEYDLAEVIERRAQYIAQRATPRSGGHSVRIKFLTCGLPSVVERASWRSRFERHVYCAARLSHPHILPVLGGGIEGELAYVIEPEPPGETLRQRMDAGLTTQESARVLGQLCDALAHAHAHGLVHCRMTADDIVFDSANSAQLCNIGLARFAGTALYSIREDLRALGVLACALFTRRRVADTGTQACARLLREAVPDLDPRIRTAILSLLEPRRASRIHGPGPAMSAAGFARVIGHGFASAHGENAGAQTRPIRLLVVPTDQVVPVRVSPFPLGREQLNPGDRGISRAHGWLVFKDDVWLLSESQSAHTNGILLRGARLAGACAITAGDEFVLGGTRVRVLG